MLCRGLRAVCRYAECALLSRDMSHRLALRVSSSTVHLEGTKLQVNLPTGVLPSANFLSSKVKGFATQDRLAQLLTEMELAYLRFADHELPARMDDWHWKVYFDMLRTEERIMFLMKLRKDEDNAGKIDAMKAEIAAKRLQVIEEQQRRFENGEIVYSRHYNCLLETRGKQFLRKAIDAMYGSRLLCAQRCGDGLPQLLVDGRFMTELSDYWQLKLVREMQSLYESNWAHRHPFPLSFVNMLFDDHLALYTKKHLLFLTGPPSVKKDIPEDDLSIVYDRLQADDSDFEAESTIYDRTSPACVHPLNPIVSSHSIRRNLPNIKDEEILYVSYRAVELLDGPISQYKAFVVCATDEEMPTRRSLAAAHVDRLNVKRIPANRFLRWESRSKVLPLKTTANILREVFCNGGDWESAVINNFEKPLESSSERDPQKDPIKIARDQKIMALKSELAAKNLRQIDLRTTRRAEHYEYCTTEKKPGAVHARKWKNRSVLPYISRA